MKHRMNKIVGWYKILLSLLWIVLSIFAYRYLTEWTTSFDSSLTTGVDAAQGVVENIDNLVGQTNSIIDQLQLVLVDVETTASDASNTFDSMVPVIDESMQLLTIEIPTAIEGVSEGMPAAVEAASAVDSTLLLLSQVKLEIPNPFGTNWNLGLGVEYGPEITLEDSLQKVSGHLTTIPTDLRNMESVIQTASDNLVNVGDDASDLAADMVLMQNQIILLKGEMMNLNSSTKDLKTSMNNAIIELPDIAGSGKKAGAILMVLVILSQIPPIYSAFGMIKKNDNEEDFEYA